MTKDELIALDRKLTPSMRKALLHQNAGGTSYGWAPMRTIEALHARGLVGRKMAHGAFYSPKTAIDWPLTDLGKQLRAHAATLGD